MTFPGLTHSNMVALACTVAGLLFIFPSLTRFFSYLRKLPMRTKTTNETELALANYDFDGFECYLVLHVRYQQTHHLSAAGHSEDCPEVVSATIAHARLKDHWGNVHSAGILETQQIQRQMDCDRQASGRIQTMLEQEVCG